MSKAGGNSYIYDMNGNMTRVRDASNRVIRTMHFGHSKKPLWITTEGSRTDYTYDANQNRIQKATTETVTNYVGKIFENTVNELEGISKDTAHIYAAGKRVASIEQVTGLDPTLSYYHTDQLGSVNVITDANGNVLTDAVTGQEVGRLRFDIFGAPVDPYTGAALTGATAEAKFGTSETTRGYTGHEMDAESGLINMNARLYDPVLGRFLSADSIIPNPLNGQDFNRYAYVNNNPLRYTDPTGHEPVSAWTVAASVPGDPTIKAVAFTIAAIYTVATSSAGAAIGHEIAKGGRAVGRGISNGFKSIFGGRTTPPPVAPIVYQFSSVVSSQAYASEIRRGSPVGTVSSTGNYADARNTQAHQRLFSWNRTVTFDFNRFANDIQENRSNTATDLIILGSTLGFGTMPKTKFEIDKAVKGKSLQVSQTTNQLSRWNGRLNRLFNNTAGKGKKVPKGLRNLGRTPRGMLYGGIATGALVVDGLYNWGVIIKAGYDATSYE